jgi:hypothetical protein
VYLLDEYGDLAPTETLEEIYLTKAVFLPADDSVLNT